MIKFGVTSRDRAAKTLPRERAHAGWWPYAFTLLEDLERTYTEADELLLERLYQAISAGEGVWKITKANRFSGLDERIGEEIEERFRIDRPLVVHDMAASNGVTSLEWYERLSVSRPVTFCASDYFDRLTLVTPPSSEWTVVFDVEDRPMQCVSRQFVITCRRNELWRHPVNRLIQWRLRRGVIPAAIRHLAENPQRTADVTVADGIRRISLFHPRCLQREQTDANFCLKQHNVFAPDSQRCDVVRVMNALTPHHFSEKRLETAVRQSIKNIPSGGLFLVGRSIDEEDGRTAATVYERTDDGLRSLWDVNEGSEIKNLINSVTAPAPNIAVTPLT